jgi:hypothetical protein
MSDSYTYENTHMLLPLAGTGRAEKSGKVASPKSSHVSPLTFALPLCPFLLDPSPFPLSPASSSSIAVRSSSPPPCWRRPLRALLSQRLISHHCYRTTVLTNNVLCVVTNVLQYVCKAQQYVCQSTCLVGRCTLHTYRRTSTPASASAEYLYLRIPEH